MRTHCTAGQGSGWYRPTALREGRHFGLVSLPTVMRGKGTCKDGYRWKRADRTRAIYLDELRVEAVPSVSGADEYECVPGPVAECGEVDQGRGRGSLLEVQQTICTKHTGDNGGQTSTLITATRYLTTATRYLVTVP